MKLAKFIALMIALALITGCESMSIEQNSSVAMYRGNAENTGVYTSKAVKELPSVKWKFRPERQIPNGQSAHQPVAADGTVYYISRGMQESALYAIDIETGREKWVFDALEKASSMASRTVAVASSTVFVGVGQGDESGIIYALDAATGREKWSYETDGISWTVPIIAENIVYFDTITGYLYALDIESGQEIWVYDVEGIANYDFGAIVSDDKVFLDTILPTRFHVLDAKTGKRIEKYEETQYNAVGAVSDGALYEPYHPGFCVWDLATNQEKWCHDYIVGLPTIAENTVYGGDTYRDFYALDAETGREKWNVSMQAAVASMVAYADGFIFFGTEDQNIHALDAETGREKWNFSAPERLYWGPVIADGMLFFISEDATLYALQ